jgi:hypothetical protein
MHSLSHLVARVLGVSILFLGLASAPCLLADDDNPGTQYGVVPVPSGLTKDDLREVIVQVFTGRGWTVKEKSDRRVTGYLNHRGVESTTWMTFDAEQVEITYEGWRVNGKGDHLKPEEPKSWLNFLKKDLTKQLGLRAATK